MLLVQRPIYFLVGQTLGNYYELLEPRETITSAGYWAQFKKLIYLKRLTR